MRNILFDCHAFISRRKIVINKYENKSLNILSKKYKLFLKLHHVSEILNSHNYIF